jgi:hypothetical protein
MPSDPIFKIVVDMGDFEKKINESIDRLRKGASDQPGTPSGGHGVTGSLNTTLPGVKAEDARGTSAVGPAMNQGADVVNDSFHIGKNTSGIGSHSMGGGRAGMPGGPFDAAATTRWPSSGPWASPGGGVGSGAGGAGGGPPNWTWGPQATPFGGESQWQQPSMNFHAVAFKGQTESYNYHPDILESSRVNLQKSQESNFSSTMRQRERQLHESTMSQANLEANAGMGLPFKNTLMDVLSGNPLGAAFSAASMMSNLSNRAGRERAIGILGQHRESLASKLGGMEAHPGPGGYGSGGGGSGSVVDGAAGGGEDQSIVTVLNQQASNVAAGAVSNHLKKLSGALGGGRYTVSGGASGGSSVAGTVGDVVAGAAADEAVGGGVLSGVMSALGGFAVPVAAMAAAGVWAEWPAISATYSSIRTGTQISAMGTIGISQAQSAYYQLMQENVTRAKYGTGIAADIEASKHGGFYNMMSGAVHGINKFFGVKGAGATAADLLFLGPLGEYFNYENSVNKKVLHPTMAQNFHKLLSDPSFTTGGFETSSSTNSVAGSYDSYFNTLKNPNTALAVMTGHEFRGQSKDFYKHFNLDIAEKNIAHAGGTVDAILNSTAKWHHPYKDFGDYDKKKHPVYAPGHTHVQGNNQDIINDIDLKKTVKDNLKILHDRMSNKQSRVYKLHDDLEKWLNEQEMSHLSIKEEVMKSPHWETKASR